MGDISTDTGQPRVDPNGIRKVTVDPTTGLATVVTTIENFQKAQQAIPFFDRAMTGMQTELDRLDQEARNVQAHPVAGMLARLAGNLAAQPDMPGFVRGLGQTALETNPTLGRLTAERIPLWKELAEMGERNAMNQQRIEQMGLQRQQQADYHQGLIDSKRERVMAEQGRALNVMAEKAALTEEQVRGVLGADADPATVKAWVADSELRQERRKREEESQNLDRQAKRFQLREAGELSAARAQTEKAREGYFKTRTELAPTLNAARVGELDARAQMHAQSGFMDWQRINLETQRFAESVRRFDVSKGIDKIRIYSEIAGNPMTPDSVKQKLYADLEKQGLITKDTPRPEQTPFWGMGSQNAQAPAGAVGGVAPPGVAALPGAVAPAAPPQEPGYVYKTGASGTIRAKPNGTGWEKWTGTGWAKLGR